MASENGSWFKRRGKQPQPIRALTAAGVRLDPGDRRQARQQRAMRQGWQSDAWGYRDSIGELRYAVNFLSNCAARMRVYPAAYAGQGDENPVPLTEIQGVPPEVLAACEQAMAELGTGRLAVSALMASLSTNTTIAGECYFLGLQDPVTGRESYSIRSIDEIVIENDRYRMREVPSDPQGVIPWVDLDPDSTVISRIWTPHPRFRLLADSPLRAILDDCEALLIKRREIRAQGRSRLAGAGMLLIPDEITIKAPVNNNDDPQADPFLGQLTEAMTAPIADEGVASAVVPLLLRGPKDALEKVRHLTFASAIAKEDIQVRAELVGVIATGLDLPKEIIEGVADLNHWSAWQVDDNTFRHHVEPHVINCVDSLTDAYLRPYLEAYGVTPDWVARCALWYDPTELVTHPDQTQDAFQLHDRLAISDEALRKVAGFEKQDAPSQEEFLVRLLHNMRQWPPNMVMAAVHALDPGLTIPPITEAGTVPGVKPGGVDTGVVQAVPTDQAPAMLPAGPIKPSAPPAGPSTTAPGPPPITAAAGTGAMPTGAMVALYLPPELAASMALDGGEPVEDLHLTLAFLGEAADLPDPELLREEVAQWAAATGPLAGEISGVGLFTAGPEPVTYLSVDIPALPDARQALVDALAAHPVSGTHGFTPHVTLDYADRAAEVDAGGEPVVFDSVAVVIGGVRNDYPLTGEAAPITAAGGASHERLSRKLMQIDRDLRTRLQTAANASMLRQLERAGARLRAKVAKDETLRSKIAQRPNERVAAILGPEAVTAASVTTQELMGGDWSGLQAQFHEWTQTAQKQAVAAAIQIGGLAPEDDAVKAAETAMAAGREEAWAVLQGALTHLGHHLLYEPDPNVTPGSWGDLNPDSLVPTGLIRVALAVAGGAPVAEPTDTLTEPFGQIGTGSTIGDLIRSAGLTTEAYTWEHGPALNPFEPHEELDGVQFTSFDDDVLSNGADFPDNAFYLPGDHVGCSCDVVPMWVNASE